MQVPLRVEPHLVSPGRPNAPYLHCLAFSHHGGRLTLAFGCRNLIIVTSPTLAPIATLSAHPTTSQVTSISFSPYSLVLASSSTDNDVIIWDYASPLKWTPKRRIVIGFPALSLSLSSSSKLAIAGKSLYMYSHNSLCLLSSPPLQFCSLSPDTRFTLALTLSSRELLIFHRRARSRDDYSRIPLKHPSSVLTAQWRLSSCIHERVSFMTTAHDGVVRVWSETTVSERLSFNVVLTVNGLSAAFVTPFSSLDFREKADTEYAYGHGHLVVRDKDVRGTKTIMEENIDWVMVINNEGEMSVSEVRGLSGNGRHVPRMREVSRTPVGHRGREAYAFCHLERELESEGEPKTFTMIVNDDKRGVVERVEVEVNRGARVVGEAAGHTKKIIDIRFCEETSKIVTVGEGGEVFIWRLCDTDVYEPVTPVRFEKEFDDGLIKDFEAKMIEWASKGEYIVSINDRCELAINNAETYELDGLYAIESNSLVKIEESNRDRSNEALIDLRSCMEVDGTSVLAALFADQLYILALSNNEGVSLSLLASFPTNNNVYLAGCVPYITRLFPVDGALLYFVSDSTGQVKTVVYHGNTLKLETCMKLEQAVSSLQYSQPGYLFAFSGNEMRVCVIRKPGETLMDVMQVVTLEGIPRKLASLPPGLIAVAFPSSIDFYFPIREQSAKQWTKVATCPISDIGALEWTMDGILLSSRGAEFFAFTKFMDTSSVNCDRPTTFHHTLARMAGGTDDYDPKIMIPLAISGRIRLIEEMLSEGGGKLFTKYLIKFPDTSKNTAANTNKETTIRIDPTSTLVTEYSTSTTSRVSKNDTKGVLSEIHAVLTPETLNSLKSVESTGLYDSVLLRALLLNLPFPIPFDAFAWLPKFADQTPILNKLHITSWEDVDKSRVVFWVRDINEIVKRAVPRAVEMFEERRSLSICILVAVKRQKVLQSLFSKEGDDTRAQFFVRDFSRLKEQKSAEKNGYSALSKQDYYVAAAMFILANKLDIAIRIVVEKCRDLTMGLLIHRSYDEKNALKNIYDNYIENQMTKTPDYAAQAFFCTDEAEKRRLYDERMIQIVPCHLFKDSAAYGDLRFCIADSPLTKAHLLKSLLSSGLSFLGLQYLPDLEALSLPTDKPLGEDAATSISRSRSTTFTPLTSKSSLISRSTSVATLSNNKEKQPDLFGFTSANFTESSSESSWASSSDTEEEDDEDESDNEKGNNNIDTIEGGWLISILIFNVVRSRLEAFLETQDHLSITSDRLVIIQPELARAGVHVSSMSSQIRSYLLRSCRRRCFIYRRLLFLPTDESRMAYVMDLCRSLAHLPEVIFSTKVRKFQMLQVAHTVRVLMLSVNNGLVSLGQPPDSLFIIVSTLTAGLSLSLSIGNFQLTRSVLSVGFDVVRYPNSLCKLLDSPMDPTLSSFPDLKGNSLGFVDDDLQGFAGFLKSLVDFLTVDFFIKKLSAIDTKKPVELSRLVQDIKKMKEGFLQVLQTETRNTPEVIEIKSLKSMFSGRGKPLEALLSDLIDDEADKKIRHFCRTLIFRGHRHGLTAPILSHLKLLEPVSITTAKSPVTGLATGKGFLVVNSSMIQNGVLEEKPGSPLCVCAHPTEPFAVVGNADGSLQTLGREIQYFTNSQNPINFVKYSKDASILGIVQSGKVSLYSTHFASPYPFTTFDSFSDTVFSLDFLPGTCLLVTTQTPSRRCKASIVFWDALLPNHYSMVASVRIDGEGRACSMVYVHAIKQVIVGTSHGNLVMIDAEKFDVVSSFKAHDKGIFAMAVDANQMFLATGSGDGSVKIWNVMTMQLVSERKDVHPTKTILQEGKIRTYGVSAISFGESVIYTGGIDGSVKSIAISL